MKVELSQVTAQLFNAIGVLLTTSYLIQKETNVSSKSKDTDA